MVERLDPGRAAQLRRAPLTYDAPAASGSRAGHHSLARSRVLGSGEFESAVDALMTWRVHERAGLRVHASAPRAAVDEVVEMYLGRPPLAIRIPCRVVSVVEEQHRAGFSYGTLPDHPESGEEEFLLTREADGAVVFSISAFSRPATRLARLGGPVTRRVQLLMTDRYLAAV